MNNLEKWFHSNLGVLRRISQIGALVLVVLIPILNKNEIYILLGNFYSLSIGNLEIADPAIVAQTILLTKKVFLPLLLAGLIPIVITLFLGKVFCSWACPYFLISEMGAKLRSIFKTPQPSLKNPKPQYYWFIFAGVMLFAIISGVPIITYFSFPGLISSNIANLVLCGIVGVELFFIFVILLSEMVFDSRFWCKYFCPVGAVLSLFLSKNTLKIKLNSVACGNCEKLSESPCINACVLNLNPKKENLYPYCNHCFACVDSCQNYGNALTITFQNKEK
ncbi:MAG: 4Fe-4S binding protein [Candidatus Marinimicrobia bacterium]|nr:4Fe-4S binding protein [Candidatus Neomarinimicrobiota bacterium]